MTHDENLLFALKAFQNEWLTEGKLLGVLKLWEKDKSRPMPDLLRFLGPDKLTAIQNLVVIHVKEHGPKLAASIGLPSVGPASLAGLADPDLKAQLAGLAPPSITPPPPEVPTGERYVRKDRIGQGGMGVVHLAEDTALGRDVAIKEIKNPDHRDDRTHRDRLRDEARTTGQLEHPGIVPVYDLIANAQGQPAYVMRLFQKVTLGDEIKAFHAERGSLSGDERNIRFRELLGHVRKVCDAIGYAHAQTPAVLHLDLKPANVVIGDHGQTLVIDWGLASATAPASAASGGPASGPGTPLKSPPSGTPEYMAPEQAGGGPFTEQCDVYGLGAILYEVLTGRPPREPRDEESTPSRLDRAKTEVPPPPRAIDRTIHPALDAACRAALAPAPADRYRTVVDLAADLDRWLGDEPVSVYPERLRHRARRWVRKHPGWVGAATVALVVLMVGGPLGVWLWSRDQARQAAVREIEATVARAEDLLNAGDPEAAQALFDQARSRLADRPDLAGVADRVQRGLDRIEADKRSEQMREEVSNFWRDAQTGEFHILGAYWALLPHEDPHNQRRIIRESERSADLAAGIGAAARALAHLGLPDDPNFGTKLAADGIDRAEVSRVQARAAELLFLLAVGDERQHQGGPAAEQVAARARAVQRLDLAEQLGNRTKVLFEYRARFRAASGRAAEAEADLRTAGRTDPATFLDYHWRASDVAARVANARSTHGPAAPIHFNPLLPALVQLDLSDWNSGAVADLQQALILRPNEYWTLFRIGKTLERQRLLDQAESWLRACTTLRPEDATVRNSRGTILIDLRRFAEAVQEFEACLRYRPDYYMAYANLALAYAEQKDPARAERVLGRLPKDRRDLRAEEAKVQNNVGLAYERAGQVDRALAFYTKAVELDPEYVSALRNRSLLLAKRERQAEAMADIARAIRLDPWNGELRYVRGNLRANHKRDEAAVAEYTEAIRLNPKLVFARFNRGVILRGLGRYEEALADQNEVLTQQPGARDPMYEAAMCLIFLKDFRGAVSVLDRILGADDRDVEALQTRGKALGDQKTPDSLQASEKDLTRVLALAPRLSEVYRDRGLTRFRAEKWKDAIADYEQYLKLVPNAPDRASIYNDLSNAHLELGQTDQARTLLDRAIALDKSRASLTNRGNLRLMTGEYAGAFADLDAAIRLDRKDIRAWALRGQLHLMQGDPNKALDDLEVVLRLEQPPMYETMVLHALIRLARADEGPARTVLEQVARERPDHLRGRFARGVLDELDGKYPDAIAGLSAAVGDPTLGRFALARRARIWLRLENVSAAAADAQRLAALPGAGGALAFDAAVVLARATAAGSEPPGQAGLLVGAAGVVEVVGRPDRYAEAAVAALKQARAAGYFADPARVERLRTAPEFAPLRDRPAFRDLLADLAGKK